MTYRGPFQPLPFCDSVKMFSGGASRNYSKIRNCHKNVKCLEEFKT